MQMEIEDEYPAHLRTLLDIMRTDHAQAKARWYTNENALAADMRYPSQHNQMVFEFLDSDDGKYLRITTTRLVRALQRDAKRQEADRKRDEREERAKRKEQMKEDKAVVIQAELGGLPADEVEFVDLLVAKRGYSMTFDRIFRDSEGNRLTGEQVNLDAQLTAAQLCLVKPRGDLLSVSHIDRALSQWCYDQRKRCIQMVLERISTLPDTTTREDVFSSLEGFCALYFKEDPGYAAAAIRSMFRQIKRRLLDLPVIEPHMAVFVGEQGSGKTTIQRNMAQPIVELVAEASMKDVLDERQMELPQFALLLLDELVASDRADVSSLKNFVTGASWARRPMRTNIVEKIALRASLFGTSNHSLGRLIYDSSGMRRFIELEINTLDSNRRLPGWDEIAAFDWLLLWQAVDPYAECPLLEGYRDVLMTKQEDLRTADNCELWVTQYVPIRNHPNAKDQTHEWIEFYAQDLYSQFRMYEEEFDRGWRGTNITRWGRDLKALIDSGRLEGWSYRRVQNKTVYCLPLPSADEAEGGQSNVTPLNSLRNKLNRMRHTSEV